MTTLQACWSLSFNLCFLMICSKCQSNKHADVSDLETCMPSLQRPRIPSIRDTYLWKLLALTQYVGKQPSYLSHSVHLPHQTPAMVWNHCENILWFFLYKFFFTYSITPCWCFISDHHTVYAAAGAQAHGCSLSFFFTANTGWFQVFICVSFFFFFFLTMTRWAGSQTFHLQCFKQSK